MASLVYPSVDVRYRRNVGGWQNVGRIEKVDLHSVATVLDDRKFANGGGTVFALLQGTRGAGKTCLCKRLALEWANQQYIRTANGNVVVFIQPRQPTSLRTWHDLVVNDHQMKELDTAPLASRDIMAQTMLLVDASHWSEAATMEAMIKLLANQGFHSVVLTATNSALLAFTVFDAVITIDELSVDQCDELSHAILPPTSYTQWCEDNKERALVTSLLRNPLCCWVICKAYGDAGDAHPQTTSDLLTLVAKALFARLRQEEGFRTVDYVTVQQEMAERGRLNIETSQSADIEMLGYPRYLVAMGIMREEVYGTTLEPRQRLLYNNKAFSNLCTAHAIAADYLRGDASKVTMDYVCKPQNREACAMAVGIAPCIVETLLSDVTRGELDSNGLMTTCECLNESGDTAFDLSVIRDNAPLLNIDLSWRDLAPTTVKGLAKLLKLIDESGLCVSKLEDEDVAEGRQQPRRGASQLDIQGNVLRFDTFKALSDVITSGGSTLTAMTLSDTELDDACLAYLASRLATCAHTSLVSIDLSENRFSDGSICTFLATATASPLADQLEKIALEGEMHECRITIHNWTNGRTVIPQLAARRNGPGVGRLFLLLMMSRDTVYCTVDLNVGSQSLRALSELLLRSTKITSLLLGTSERLPWQQPLSCAATDLFAHALASTCLLRVLSINDYHLGSNMGEFMDNLRSIIGQPRSLLQNVRVQISPENDILVEDAFKLVRAMKRNGTIERLELHFGHRDGKHKTSVSMLQQLTALEGRLRISFL